MHTTHARTHTHTHENRGSAFSVLVESGAYDPSTSPCTATVTPSDKGVTGACNSGTVSGVCPAGTVVARALCSRQEVGEDVIDTAADVSMTDDRTQWVARCRPMSFGWEFTRLYLTCLPVA